MISWKLAAERSARAEDVVAQQHPQQKQNADGNAHHVEHQVSDPSALLAPIHFSLLPRRVASHAGESRACASSAQRQRPENNGRGGRREAQGCILCTGCRSFPTEMVSGSMRAGAVEPSRPSSAPPRDRLRWPASGWSPCDRSGRSSACLASCDASQMRRCSATSCCTVVCPCESSWPWEPPCSAAVP